MCPGLTCPAARLLFVSFSEDLSDGGVFVATQQRRPPLFYDLDAVLEPSE